MMNALNLQLAVCSSLKLDKIQIAFKMSLAVQILDIKETSILKKKLENGLGPFFSTDFEIHSLITNNFCDDGVNQILG